VGEQEGQGEVIAEASVVIAEAKHDYDLKMLPRGEHGAFTDGDAYVVHASFKRGAKHVLYVWQGRECPSESRTAAALRSLEVLEDLWGRQYIRKQQREQQQREKQKRQEEGKQEEGKQEETKRVAGGSTGDGDGDGDGDGEGGRMLGVDEGMASGPGAWQDVDKLNAKGATDQLLVEQVLIDYTLRTSCWWSRCSALLVHHTPYSP
jgi:hypothetical protein